MLTIEDIDSAVGAGHTQGVGARHGASGRVHRGHYPRFPVGQGVLLGTRGHTGSRVGTSLAGQRSLLCAHLVGGSHCAGARWRTHVNGARQAVHPGRAQQGVRSLDRFPQVRIRAWRTGVGALIGGHHQRGHYAAVALLRPVA